MKCMLSSTRGSVLVRVDRTTEVTVLARHDNKTNLFIHVISNLAKDKDNQVKSTSTEFDRTDASLIEA